MRLLIVLRGLPGSGKSTLAREILRDYAAIICSADDFFVDVDGNYHFNPGKLTKAHAVCQRRAEAAMKAATPVVIIDNTNVSSREWQPYIDLARRYDYQVEFREPTTPWAKDPDELARRNTHGVPKTTIERMLARWEKTADVRC